jgi:hypothetical protein
MFEISRILTDVLLKVLMTFSNYIFEMPNFVGFKFKNLIKFKILVAHNFDRCFFGIPNSPDKRGVNNFLFIFLIFLFDEFI